MKGPDHSVAASAAGIGQGGPERVTVVGNPDDRRTVGFAAAARAAGLAVDVVPWGDVLDGTVHDLRGAVRLDSTGSDAALDARLRGGPVAAPAQIGSSRRWHRGFVRALAAVPARDDQLLNARDEVGTLFDKTACAARLADAGVAVPPALATDVSSFDEVVDGTRSARWGRVFVKPRYGSSGAGVVALMVGPSRVEAVSNVEVDAAGRRFASTRVHRTSGERGVASLIDGLGADDALRVERWYPKAGLAGRTFDLRIVVIAGEPQHVVVRAAAHPITNLNLGGGRGDADEVRARMGVDAWDAVLATCRRVGAAFPGCLHVGVDILVSPDLRRHVVGEVNAFGDLLPGVLHAGRSTFEAEVDALARFGRRTVAA